MPQIEPLTESPPFPVNSPGPEESDPVASPEIVTLDSRLDAVESSSGLPDHLADATDAHDASAISFVPTGSLSATDVQGAIVEAAAEAAGITGRGAMGRSGILTPTGNVAADTAAINAALATNLFSLTLTGDFTINASLVLQSNTTLYLVDAKVRLANAVNKPILVNANPNATGNTGINVVGIGRAILDGNDTNQVRGALRDNTGILLVNTHASRFHGFTIGPTNYSVVMTQVCTDLLWTRIHIAQSNNVNRGGFEIGPGCSNIMIDGVTGVMYDDLLDVAAFRSSIVTNSGYIHPYTESLTDAQRNCSDITIRNADVLGAIMLRCLNGDGSTIKNVTAENITNRKITGEQPVVVMGPALTYTTDAPAVGSISNVVFRGYQGPASRLVALDSHVNGLSISDCQITNWRHLVGNQFRNAAFFPVLTRIRVCDIQITGDWTDQGAALDDGGTGTLCKFDNGVNVDDLEIGNVQARVLRGITRNGSALSGSVLANLSIHDIHAGSSISDLFGSSGTETGDARNINVIAPGGKAIATATGLRFGGQFPSIAALDTSPSPVIGSRIICDASKNISLTAGYTTAGEYLANGTEWKRVVDLGAYQPLSGTLIAAYDADTLAALSDGDPVTTWADDTGNGHTLTQATGTKQPTYKAAVTELNAKKAVRFDGVDDFLQCASFANVTPVTVLVSFVWRTVPGGNAVILDGRSVGGPAANLLLYKPSTQMVLYGGGSLNGGVPTALTGYVLGGRIAAAGSTLGGFIYRNALTAITNGNAGGGGVDGITVGADRAGATPSPIDVRRIRVYRGVLTVADLATAMNALGTDAAITIGA